MTCREINSFLDAYLNDRLTSEERARFDAHLAMCESCVAYVATYRSAIEMGIRALESDPDLDVPASLLRAIMAARH